MLHKYKFECIIDESERLPSDGSCMTNGRVGVIIIIVDIDRERNTRYLKTGKKTITGKVIAIQFMCSSYTST